MNRLIRTLIQRSAQWRPEAERDDYVDENLDLLDAYIDDGHSLAALRLAAIEFVRTAASFGVPTWWVKPGRPELAASWTLGFLYFALITAHDSGATFIGLSLGAMIAAPVCACISLISGRVRGLTTPSGRRFDNSAYMLSSTLVMWVIATTTAGWLGWAFGLAGFVIALVPVVLHERGRRLSP